MLEALAAKAKTRELDIKALVHPEELKGYVLVEGELSDIEKAVREIPHARGIIRKPISIEEISRFLTPKEVEIELRVNDLVEVIGGPFKGEKGKVKRFDKTKREVTIELLEVAIPIPVTISADLVRLVKKAEE